MIDMHSKYNNMHKSKMFYLLIYINNHILICINCMLSMHPKRSIGMLLFVFSSISSMLLDKVFSMYDTIIFMWRLALDGIIVCVPKV